MSEVKNDSLSDVQRISVICAANFSEAEALLQGCAMQADSAALGRRVGLDSEHIQHLLSSPTKLRAERIDPNNINALQLKYVSGMDQSRIPLVLHGGPYFTLDEFESTSGLDSTVVRALFSTPALHCTDKVSGRSRCYTPVLGKFVTSESLDFESVHNIQTKGFAVSDAGLGSQLRLISNDMESNADNVHAIKQALGGQVYPVLQDDNGTEHYFLPANIDVWFHRSESTAESLKLLHTIGLRVVFSSPSVGFYQVDLGQYTFGESILSACLDKIAELQEHESIRLAELTEVGIDTFIPTREVKMTDFEDAGPGDRLWHHKAIELAAAHEITRGSANVNVIVIDSGIDLQHQDLTSALRPDWQQLDLNFDTRFAPQVLTPQELSVSHGTKVASIACGRGEVGVSRVKGVAPGCWLLPVKISGSSFGQSYGLRAVAIQEAIAYVAPGSRGVINISWATQGEHLGIREALIDASEKGFVVVTSAGNFRVGETQAPDLSHYPSEYAMGSDSTDTDVLERRKIRGLISVAAVNAANRKASYSYYGEQSVTVSAPGGEQGASGTGMFVASTPENYSYDAGTSFAAPMVAGVAALILSIDPSLSNRSVIDFIESSSQNLDDSSPAYKNMLGSGLLNARRALELVRAGVSETSGSQIPTTPIVQTSAVPVAQPPVTPIDDHRLNINTASVQSLASLSVFGIWSATQVVNYRNTHGLYATIWDMSRSGACDYWTIQQLEQLIKA